MNEADGTRRRWKGAVGLAVATHCIGMAPPYMYLYLLSELTSVGRYHVGSQLKTTL